jgi:hypothetical protein
MKKNILNISRLHQQELWSIIKMLPDDPMNQYIITGYKIINPDDPSSGQPPMPQPKDVTVAQYNAEVAAYNQKHMNDPMVPPIQILETYTTENVLSPDIVNNINIIDATNVPQDLSTSDKYDLVVVGVGDTGVDIFKKIHIIDPMTGEITSEYSQLQVLSDARDAGMPIVFTHDALEVNSFCEPFPDDYDKLVGNFGVDSHSYDYGEEGNQINNIRCIDPTHNAVTAYYELEPELEVQPSHAGGLKLLPDAKILFEESSKASSNANYYLAVYEKSGKGKVVFCQLGHCYGNHNQFFRPSINECKILVNAIIWALQ